MAPRFSLPRYETPEDLPGQVAVKWRREPGARILATIAAVCWPPLLTLAFWPPKNWVPGLDIDWRLGLLLVGLIAVPTGLQLLERSRKAAGKPSTRLGVIWRFILWGGLLAAGLQVLIALAVTVVGWFGARSLFEGLGVTETTLLIYGVGGLPVAILVGVSYALWAGLCVAFIAFRKAPEPVNDRLGLMRGR
ncbi:phthalate transporter [Brevundimonas sp. VNH65]|uniref:phthalate transporter n=1 Tax=Brevundimonas sp. VNH65 TaxID=3400917 RepID=UPI003C0EF767